MTFKKNFFRLAGIVIATILVSGCLTDRSPLHVQDKSTKEETYEGVTITLKFVDEAILKAKYKEEYNPFLTDYYSIQLKRLIVFELTVDNKSPGDLLFVLNRLELQYSSKPLHTYNRFHLSQHWEFTDDDSETDASDIARREKIINNTVLPNSNTLRAGGIMRGYAVFAGNTPNYGPAMVYIPLFKTKDVVFHRFEFPFEF